MSFEKYENVIAVLKEAKPDMTAKEAEVLCDRAFEIAFKEFDAPADENLEADRAACQKIQADPKQTFVDVMKIPPVLSEASFPYAVGVFFMCGYPFLIRRQELKTFGELHRRYTKILSTS